ncbi:hypothetical protein CTI12_AA057870 [Artemisia annua]|uniref:Reverse transcriptase zinc-binding domain-containing protein n=1 Tax=Artemisia annua TaxID=35608 RepID=A0A2U1NV54_ARTAN|nr:hypothetical protein CTI12_AA057870 [Artemisia annua]
MVGYGIGLEALPEGLFSINSTSSYIYWRMFIFRKILTRGIGILPTRKYSQLRRPETRWCRFIPKKVNILSWRVLRDRLPNRWNLSRKGIDIPSLLCPVFSSFPETNFHLFWDCNVASAIWKFVFRWVDIHPPNILDLTDLFNWLDESTSINSFCKTILSLARRWNIVMHGKRRIVGVENVVDEDEYNQFDELPPFSIGIQSLDVVLDDTTYLRSDHQEGYEAED